jgi:hypothetical protein
MKRFEYDITIHPADAFRELVYFCAPTGECQPKQVPGDQETMLIELLNARGKEGWELVQLFFQKESLLAFWKRT